jgi:hypothetical protein
MLPENSHPKKTEKTEEYYAIRVLVSILLDASFVAFGTNEPTTPWDFWVPCRTFLA